MSVVRKDLRPRITELLKTVASSWTVRDDNSVEMSNWSVRFVEAALVQLLDLSSVSIPRSEFEYCIHRALMETVRAGTTTADALNDRLELEIRKHRRKKTSAHRIFSHCYFSLPAGSEVTFKLFGVDAQLSATMPDVDLSDFELNGYGHVRPIDPVGGAYCEFIVRTKTERGALDVAADHVSAAFGALNFWLNVGNLRERFGKPEMRAILFPGSELFLVTDGKLSREFWSYYTVVPHRLQSLSAGNIERLSNVDKLYKAVSGRSKADQAFYKTYFNLYFDALTESDVDYALVRLWKAAEFAVGSSNVDTIARRLSAPWTDRETVKAICFAAGLRRNAIMHGTDQGLRQENLAEVFRNLLDGYVWRSLGQNVGSVTIWRAALELIADNSDLRTLEKAIPLAKKLSVPTRTS